MSAEFGRYGAVKCTKKGRQLLKLSSMILQIQNKKSTSANMISDRQQKNTIYNKWLKKNIEYSSNTVEDGSTEYEAVLLENGGAYYLFGNMPKLEFEKILKNIIFY
jgi:hypothetical protein